VQPRRSETFKFSTDPELVAKVTDVVGLYLAPPDNGVVFCVDEKSQIRAMDRTQKMLPMQPGFPERRTHDYVRHGTSTLFAAPEIATGTVAAACQSQPPPSRVPDLSRTGRPRLARHRSAPGDGQLRSSQAPRDQSLAGSQPRCADALTPTSGSWLSLVEVWFGIIERQAIHRGTFRSVRDLKAKIRAFVDGWNDRRRPFVWTRTADHILKKANRHQTSETAH
jgi:hypothetical protein